LRCCDLLNHCYFELRPARCCVHPPFAELPPRHFLEHLLDAGSRLKRGYEPLGARCARYFFNALTLRHPGGCPFKPAVEVRKTARRWRCPTFARYFRTSRSHSPCGIPCHRRFASRRPRDPYPRGLHCRVHANGRGVRRLTRRVHASLGFPSRYGVCARKRSGAVMDVGRHGVTGFEVTTRSDGHNSIESAAAHSRLSPRG
jgi:hypothetical protein